uniref:Uncharacterized protein n=1 Tax=Alexandrium andersonii TaxID=327968 RepID=A0A7S2IZH4_9DINO|mmetsp:Transcript_91736/g.205390  ORF Transcript_91736/g.205390 Transcript_91736/m.205390 type:complete len:185 (+) Transcript_91736:2-556(+)
MGWEKWLKTVAPELVPEPSAKGEEVDTPAFTVPVLVEQAGGIMDFTGGTVTTETVEIMAGPGILQCVEALQVDSKRGPKVLLKSGGSTYVSCSAVPWHAQRRAAPSDYGKGWAGMTTTEQEVIKVLVAKKNAKMREWQEADKAKAGKKKRDISSAMPWDDQGPPSWLSWSAAKRLDEVAGMTAN